MFDKLKEEIDSIMERDPAARSRAEVYFLYSGFRAVRLYRRANWFYRHNMKFIARFISQRARHKTGIEIHPGATIGKGLFIDHGTLGNNVLVGSGAKVLGPFKVGDNARIAAGAVVLTEVPENATAVGVPARIVRVNGVKPPCSDLDQIHITDPVYQKICQLENEITVLKEKLGEKNEEEKTNEDL